MAWELFDFIDLRQRRVVAEWLKTLDAGMRARMRLKLMSIRTFGGDGLPGMVTDTRERHIKEIVLNAKQAALRIFLCRGPINPRSQVTLLGGGRERDTKYVTKDPHITPQEAETYRQQLFADPQHRRKPHEFPEDNLG